MTLQSVKSPAKVNLTLDVLGEDPSGYHRILTVYQEVPTLFDELTFEPLNTPEIIVECNNPDVPEDNTVLKAAQLLHKKTPKKGVKITLTKNIPTQSGLGGASSNAATTLKELNTLWGLDLMRGELLTLGTEIGMDVPFFILGGTALGMHFGEHLMPLPSPKIDIEIIQTDIKIPTQDAYTNLDPLRCGGKEKETGRLAKILQNEKKGPIEPLIHNDFDSQFFGDHPELGQQYPGAHLCGSGGALFRVKPHND